MLRWNTDSNKDVYENNNNMGVRGKEWIVEWLNRVKSSTLRRFEHVMSIRMIL